MFSLKCCRPFNLPQHLGLQKYTSVNEFLTLRLKRINCLEILSLKDEDGDVQNVFAYNFVTLI